MAFDAFFYTPTHKSQISGETQDEDMASLGAFELMSFELGAENNINIGSISGGGGAGKATFKEFSITKKTDTASTGLFHALVTGTHIDEAIIELRRTSGDALKSGTTFMKFEFRLLMVQDISWSGATDDDIPEEAVIFQYGAILIHYMAQDEQGKMLAPKEAKWSRIKNNASLIV